VRCDNPKGNGGEKTVDKIVVPAKGIYLRCPRRLNTGLSLPGNQRRDLQIGREPEKMEKLEKQ
jgi:hypothetical protein